MWQQNQRASLRSATLKVHPVGHCYQDLTARPQQPARHRWKSSELKPNYHPSEDRQNDVTQMRSFIVHDVARKYVAQVPQLRTTLLFMGLWTTATTSRKRLEHDCKDLSGRQLSSCAKIVKVVREYQAENASVLPSETKYSLQPDGNTCLLHWTW